MGTFIWSTFRALVWPALLPLGAALAFLAVGNSRLPQGPWWDFLPHIFMATGALLAFRFGSGRVFAITATIWFGLESNPSIGGTHGEPVLLFVALGLLFASILPERGLRSWSFLLMSCPAIATASYLSWPVAWQAQTHSVLALSQLTGLPTIAGIPSMILILYLVSGGVLIGRLSKAGTPIDSGLFGIGICWLVAFKWTGDTQAVFTLCLALMVFLTALETTHSLAFRDQLTGLPSRRALERTLGRLGSQYTLAMVDVDSFKKFNDRYGHDAGDEALRMIAGHLRRVSGGGRAYRYGGEEFTVVFPNRSIEHASQHLDELRQAVAQSPFTLRAPDRPRRKPKRPNRSGGRGKVKVTVSIGAAQRSSKMGSTTAVLKAADKCLYKAKRGGRNRLVTA
ncbi:MAG: hypothetical protein CMH52_10330 [Myxococcales bacterium]|nr:hypothetical protein [Myxococcales bacterium]